MAFSPQFIFSTILQAYSTTWKKTWCIQKISDWYVQILQLLSRHRSFKFTMVPSFASTSGIQKRRESREHIRRAVLWWITESCSQPTSLAPCQGQLGSSSTLSGCIWWWWLAWKKTWEREERWDRVNFQEHIDSCRSTQNCNYWELQHGHCLGYVV